MTGDPRFGKDLVRALLAEQHRDLAHLELVDVEGGWDNQQWRLGSDLGVRLPRTERAPGLLVDEQTWLLLPDGGAEDFFAAYGRADAAMIRRARGWAVLRASGLVAIGRAGRLRLPGGKPTWENAGHLALGRLLAT